MMEGLANFHHGKPLHRSLRKVQAHYQVKKVFVKVVGSSKRLESPANLFEELDRLP